MSIELYPPFFINEIGQRENNEDAVYPNIKKDLSNNVLFIVCDGVGGMEKGEIASHIVATTVAQQLKLESSVEEKHIAQAVSAAERELRNHITAHPDASGMATTLTLIYIDDNKIIAGHAGDSRIYQFRDGKIIFKSQDHSYVNELISKNIISEMEAQGHPQRNVITRALSGSDNPQQLDFSHVHDVQTNDYFFLCTDGVLEAFDDDDLMHIFSDNSISNKDKIDRIKLKCQMEAKDNYSAFLIQIRSAKMNKFQFGNFDTAFLENNIKYVITFLVLAIFGTWWFFNGGDELPPGAEDRGMVDSTTLMNAFGPSNVEMTDTNLPLYDVFGKNHPADTASQDVIDSLSVMQTDTVLDSLRNQLNSVINDTIILSNSIEQTDDN